MTARQFPSPTFGRRWYVTHDGHRIGSVYDLGYGIASMDLDFKPVGIFDSLPEAALDVWSWRRS